MAGKIIMLVCMWICGGLFLGIGLYARRRRDPMWFWSGVKVPRESVPQMCRPITGLTAAYFSSTPCPGGWAGFGTSPSPCRGSDGAALLHRRPWVANLVPRKH